MNFELRGYLPEEVANFITKLKEDCDHHQETIRKLETTVNELTAENKRLSEQLEQSVDCHMNDRSYVENVEKVMRENQDLKDENKELQSRLSEKDDNIAQRVESALSTKLAEISQKIKKKQQNSQPIDKKYGKSITLAYKWLLEFLTEAIDKPTILQGAPKDIDTVTDNIGLANKPYRYGAIKVNNYIESSVYMVNLRFISSLYDICVVDLTSKSTSQYGSAQDFIIESTAKESIGIRLAFISNVTYTDFNMNISHDVKENPVDVFAQLKWNSRNRVVYHISSSVSPSLKKKAIELKVSYFQCKSVVELKDRMQTDMSLIKSKTIHDLNSNTFEGYQETDIRGYI